MIAISGEELFFVVMSGRGASAHNAQLCAHARSMLYCVRSPSFYGFRRPPYDLPRCSPQLLRMQVDIARSGCLGDILLY